MKMTRELYDIWENPRRPVRPWCLQLIGYIAGFKTEKSAQLYRDAVIKHREALTPKAPPKGKK